MVRPSPLSRSIEMPGMRCSDSARLASGKIGDVFGVDGVDHDVGLPFDVQRALQGGAVAGDDHGLDLLAPLAAPVLCGGAS
jgi:hypothetical protein